MIRFAALLVALLTPAAALAQQAPLVLHPPANIRFTVRTIEIASTGGTRLKVDVFAPARTKPKGAVILISGAGDARDWPNYIDLAKLAVARGLVAVIPEKRFPRAGGLPAVETSQDDSLALFNALGEHGPIGVSPERTCAWLFSGGGLQMGAVFNPDAPQLGCAVGFYPALGLRAEDKPQAWIQRHAPIAAFTALAATRHVPLHIVRAGKDNEGLNRAIGEFTAAALAANYDFELRNLPDAVHAFDLFDDTEWSRQAIRDAFDFITAHVAR